MVANREEERRRTSVEVFNQSKCLMHVFDRYQIRDIDIDISMHDSGR